MRRGRIRTGGRDHDPSRRRPHRLSEVLGRQPSLDASERAPRALGSRAGRGDALSRHGLDPHHVHAVSDRHRLSRRESSGCSPYVRPSPRGGPLSSGVRRPPSSWRQGRRPGPRSASETSSSAADSVLLRSTCGMTRTRDCVPLLAQPMLSVMRGASISLSLAVGVAILALAAGGARASEPRPLTSSQVILRFKVATKAKLLADKASAYPGHYVALSLPPSITNQAQYGRFILYVVGPATTAADIEQLLADGHTGVLGTPGCRANLLGAGPIPFGRQVLARQEAVRPQPRPLVVRHREESRAGVLAAP